MASKRTFKNLAVKLIKKTAGDIAVPATFVFKSGFDYNTQSATNTTEVVDEVFISSYSANELNAKGSGEIKVEVGDVKMYVVKDDLTQDPRLSSSVIAGGVTYSLMSVGLDAAEAAYVIQLRR
jgi:hypothetical protein